jgi:galactonate dehydratase
MTDVRERVVGGTSVKITQLRTFIVDAGSGNWVFVKVYTDEGLVGLGEGTITSKSQTVAAAIMEHERYLIGKDPRQIERLWQAMYRYPRWRGGPVLNSAISAIEIALWDILGKSLNVPIYQLLGGACRDRIRMYAHVSGRSPEEIAERSQKLVEQGYTALKTSPLVVNDGVVRSNQGIREGVAKVRAMREAVGPDVDILLDAHGQFTPVMALDMAERLVELQPFFFEEATQPEDVDGLAWLSERVRIPLATGERLFTKYGFTQIVDRHLVNYIQPDIVHCGGILELKKIAAMAEAHSIDVAPHNPQSEVSTMASIHLNACTPNAVILEHVHANPPWRYDLFDTTYNVKDGYAELPTKPGLGLELNEAETAKHPYRADFRNMWVWEDGSVADA